MCAYLTEVSCTAGYYSLGSQSSCTPCPGGSECPSTTAAPTACTAGSYASNQSIACTTCAAGFYCPNNEQTEQWACPTGSYQTATGQTSCISCTAGKLNFKKIFYMYCC